MCHAFFMVLTRVYFKHVLKYVMGGGQTTGAMMLHLKIYCVKEKKIKQVITINIFLGFLNIKKSLLLIWAVSKFGKLRWCWLHEQSFVTTLQMYISFVEGNSWLHPLMVHSMSYLKSLKLGWEVETNFMKTVIWVSFFGVQYKYQTIRIILRVQYIVIVHVSWILKYLNNTIIVYCRPYPLSSHALHILTQSLFS